MKLKPFQKLILNLGDDTLITPKNIMRKYDVSYNCVKKNLHELNEKGLIVRVHHRLLVFKLK